MSRPLFFAPSRSALAGYVIFLVSLLPALSACAAKEVPIHTERGGNLPASGRVVVRSGLAWMNEQSPLFRNMSASLAPLLRERGLTVVEAPPSTLSPMPGPRDSGPTASAPTGSAPKPDAAAGDQAAADAAAKSAPGKPLKLPPYSVADSDAKLPPSVMAVVPIDPMEILFARSQKDGMPLLRRGGRIPGRIPPEMLTADPSLAEYTLVVRLTMVRPQAARSSGGGVKMFGGAVGGVSTLGYGAPAPSAPPAPVYGGTPQDYARGYEGGSPTDTWGRQNDMLARDYMTKYGPQPQYATPPGAPGAGGSPSGAAGSARAGTGPSGEALVGDPIFLSAVPGGVTGFALEMELYDLRNISDKPTPIWRGLAQRRADAAGFAAALPDMLQKALGK